MPGIGKTVEFQCNNDWRGKGCTLAGVHFEFQDYVKVTLAKPFIPAIMIGRGGVWDVDGADGYTHHQIKRVAAEIVDVQTGAVIWRKGVTEHENSI